MRLSEIEYPSNAPAAEAVARAAATFKRDGYVIFESVLPREDVEILQKQYLEALQRKISRFNLGEESATAAAIRQRPGGYFTAFRPVSGNRDFRRWEMHLPSEPLFLDPRLIAHPLMMSLLEAIDESYRDCIPDAIGSDCAMPGCAYQRAHQDRPILEVFLNIPLVDLEIDNGPLEIWPGTHQPAGAAPGEFFKGPLLIPQERVDEIAASIAPRVMTIPAGSFLLRDLRMIHRGTPNVTSEPRPMISVTYGRLRSVPHRMLLDRCLGIAEGIRNFARRNEPKASRPTLLNMGNSLGRMTESSGLTDRYGHRAISRGVWEQLPEASRHALRYAKLTGIDNPRIDEHAEFAASLRFVWKFSKRLALMSLAGAVQAWKQRRIDSVSRSRAKRH